MLRNQRQIENNISKFIDGLFFALSLWLAHGLRGFLNVDLFGAESEIASFWGEPSGRPYIWISLLLLFTAPITLNTQGFYSQSYWTSRKQVFWLITKATMIVTLGIILGIFALKIQLTRSVIILFAIICIMLMLIKEEIWQFIQNKRMGRPDSQKRLILLGSESETREMLERIGDGKNKNYRVMMEFNINRDPINELVQNLHKHSVNVVLINAGHTKFDLIEKVINACELEGVEVWLAADFFNTQIARTTVDDFQGVPLLVFQTTPAPSLQSLTKQMIDYIAAFTMILILSPLLLICALSVKLTSQGPIMFRQKRSGINGRPFTMFKFRSMNTNAEQRKHELEAMNEMSGPVFKVSSDPRITPIGKILRKYSLDELPQLINVLQGSMSLVGPRPLPEDETKRFEDLSHRRRLSVKPGLTCLWQISGRNEVKEFSDWVRLDLEYIDNWSLWLDIKILIRTIPVVFKGTGAH
ncbi:MAG: exopolysaccharide biosynthesis polyprenyl glycosylphosphotransferase [Opitutia bacterium TMED67]|nr:exopolysaccharide biosynthesis polyprenyl glycosylphosphotransferase [Verrucomicrobiales bacterium]OUU72314.1 MAG: exopolysaccharide biosynthesis polyprenyl glycosylphosphotransferase [Opitutae bacterium TMED67]